VKEEDVQPLQNWRSVFGIPILVFQVFIDELHFAPLDTIVGEGKLREDKRTGKLTYFYPVTSGTRLADIEDVRVEAKLEFYENGKLVVFPVVSGGRFVDINEDATRRLSALLKSGKR